MTPEMQTLVELYRKMWTVRLLERKVEELVTAAKIPCSGHFGLGQEAVGVGVASALETRDRIFGTHRGFAEYIGKGMRPRAILSEYFGRATSPSEGRLGQHLLDVAIGVMPLPSSLGSEFGMAVGCALSSRRLGDGRVTINIFGEGTASQTDCAPSIEMAVLWNLPIIYVCNNNQYVELDRHRNVSPTNDVAPRAGAYGMEFEIADGNDVSVVYATTRRAIERARSGEGPSFLEFKTYRRGTHYTGDPGGYQPEEEIAEWERRDPIDGCRGMLIELGALDDESDRKLIHEVTEEIEDAARFAEESPLPEHLGLEAFAAEASLGDPEAGAGSETSGEATE